MTAANATAKKVVDEGGDTASLDLARAQVDEAWEVLSDQGRRKRYDAMLALVDTPIADAHALWDETAGAIIDPAAATAAELLQASTTLHIRSSPNDGRTGAAQRAAARSHRCSNRSGADAGR